MAKANNITREELCSIVRFDPKTGVFHWLNRNDIPSEWNKRWAGKVSGSCHKAT